MRLPNQQEPPNESGRKLKYGPDAVSGNKHSSVALHQNHAIVFIEIPESNRKC